MFLGKNLWWLQNEFNGEGGDLGGAPDLDGAPNPDGIQDADADEVETNYLFGDVTPDEAADRWGYLRELPEHLRGLESRVSDNISPVLDQLTSLSERIGSQPAFEPKLEKVLSVLKEYDPKLAETLGPALIEDLKASMNITPMGPELLEPHISPMLQQQQQAIMEQMVPTLLDSLPFDSNAIVNRTADGRIAEPETDLQKDFFKWWEQSDAPTREALKEIGMPYVSALQKFAKWRGGHLRRRTEEAGNNSARLQNAAQRTNGGRRDTNSSNKLRTEEDGFNAIFSDERS